VRSSWRSEPVDFLLLVSLFTRSDCFRNTRSRLKDSRNPSDSDSHPPPSPRSHSLNFPSSSSPSASLSPTTTSKTMEGAGACRESPSTPDASVPALPTTLFTPFQPLNPSFLCPSCTGVLFEPVVSCSKEQHLACASVRSLPLLYPLND
jgi:hypothetical protein